MHETPRPRRAIRRFDVFAEYQKLKALREGRPLREAKGYGLWLAKVVAGRRYGAELRQAPGEGRSPEPTAGEEEPFRSVGGVPQTDERFDHEIIERMGEAFYQRVFAPAIDRCFARGEPYEAIRDAVRKEWKP